MKSALALVCTLLFAVSGALLASANHAHAQEAVTVVGGELDSSLLDLAKNTLTSIETTLTANSAFSLQIKEYVLDPIAWLLSQQMIQQIAGSVINFVNGQGNGSGSPQFVQDLLGFLQNVGDNQAFSFLAQFVGSSNSPFASSIASSLRTNYLQETSTGGFFSANSCTLSQFSSNVTSYLGGNWTQGGVSSWFALTTQNQNNPYTLYNRSSNQLGALVIQAQTSQQEQLGWGQGFLSWCDSTGASSGPSIPGLTPVACLNADGTAGSIETPGSVIHDQLAKVLGAGVDKLVSADEINEIIGQLAMGLISSVLGGSSGGLYGVSQSSNNSASYVNQYQSESPTPGSSSSGSSSTGSVSDMAIQNVNNYEAVANAIIGAANSAISAENNLANTCSQYATSAQSTITSQIDPVITEQQSLISTAETTRALAQKVASEQSPTTSAGTQQLLADSNALVTATPTASDVVIAQQNQSSAVGQMNTIANQANTQLAACTASNNQNQNEGRTGGR